jgi:hypothetical protein
MFLAFCNMKFMDITFQNLFHVSQKTASDLEALIGECRLEKESDFVPRIQQKSYIHCLAKKQNLILKPVIHAITTML